ncbi:conserved hypothetical protein [Uncinocarpus reesii 1704]|uniref:Ankyrin repeat protein nuc-2 n=1 Tax=Uncinocarpus reesii (strain UAMH 1704) TaxID=336963 RepID=C4JT62_UNCRE|nr:uncharacterized protein UREG_05651 [Uncinocarpus reesii 1704]EEP80809.1 conserved hypothetical protein [Uncinocarpus reesii 1704]
MLSIQFDWRRAQVAFPLPAPLFTWTDLGRNSISQEVRKAYPAAPARPPRLIKQLSATPTIPAQGASVPPTSEILDPQAALRANKEVFFFRLFSLRLKTLLDKQRVVQSKRSVSNSKAPANFVTLFEGFQQFDGDLNKLQQFVEVNETAVSKILKKSRTKELYLQRAVEVQPCFNRDVLRDLSDRATTARLELEAWAEGENIQFDTSQAVERSSIVPEEDDADLHALHTAATGNLTILKDWVSKLQSSQDAGSRVTRIFLAAINDFSDEVLTLLLDTGLVDMHAEDDINERNCLHEAAISGREFVLRAALERGVDVSHTDVYGRIPLHYACMHGRVEIVRALVNTGPLTIDFMDHDNFTPLIHSIIRDQLSCVEQLLSHNARINPSSESDHVPLNLACQHASLPIIQMLLERKAKLLPDAEGLYPQHLVARTCRSPEVILLLKSHGADLDQKDKLYQWTPLFHAASEGCVDCLRTLLDSGVDADALDEKDLPAMYYAVWEGHLECMILLWSRRAGARVSQPLGPLNGANFRDASSMTSPALAERPGPGGMEADGIPDLSLPPPIIPLRRYGHNFLDNKTFLQIYFEPAPSEPIVFYQAGRYAAARLTISSKMSDLIPRNIMLPFQEDSRIVSFQIDRLDNFTLEFEIFPTFGSKVIAKTVALSDIFTSGTRSSGSCCLPLFDPRLRPIGEIKFDFQVIKPYYGEPLEITHFATYWKATGALDSDHNGQITGSSLSGDYVQLFVQLTRDGVPVLYPEFTVNHHGIDIPVCSLTYDQFKTVSPRRHSQTHSDELTLLRSLEAMNIDDLPNVHRVLATSFLTLREVLAHLPTSIHVNICALYPSAADEKEFGLGPQINVNAFADSILTEVFNHARSSKENNPYFMRSIVFTSYNPNICIALNWKQPNYPVVLCNDLGQIRDLTKDATSQPPIRCSGRASMSIKEAARIAQTNNLMGLMCRSSLLNVMPALVESIKEQGLVLVADTSDEAGERTRSGTPINTEWAYRMPTGVNGVMRGTGVLRFNDTVDM